MEVKNSLANIQRVIQSLPLEEILKVAESLSSQTPDGAAGISSTENPSLAKDKGIAYVIKLLKLLISWKDMLGSNTDQVPETNSQDSQSDMGKDERARMLDMLDQMIDLAAEDGEITPEEEENLLDMARNLGLDEQDVLSKVRQKCSEN